MIPHQHVGMNHPSGLSTHLAQTSQPGLPLTILREIHLTPTSPGHYVIHCAGIFDSQLPGHLLNFLSSIIPSIHKTHESRTAPV